MAFSGTQYTRLGPSATSRELNGSFASKSGVEAASTSSGSSSFKNIRMKQRRRYRSGSR